MGDDVWSALGFSPNYGRQLFPLTFFILQSLPLSQAVRGVCRLLALCAHALYKKGFYKHRSQGPTPRDGDAFWSGAPTSLFM